MPLRLPAQRGARGGQRGGGICAEARGPGRDRGSLHRRRGAKDSASTLVRLLGVYMFLSIYVSLCLSLCVYIHTCMITYMHACVHACIPIYTYIYIYIYTHMFLHLYV